MMAIDRTKLTKQAEGQLSSGHTAKAIKILLELLEDNPKDLNLTNRIGDLYLQVNGESEAIAMFKRAAVGFEEDGFLHKAIAVFKKALRSCPEDTDVATRLADLYKRIKMPKDAIQMHVQLADAFSKKGDFQRALKELAEVASLDPRNIKNKIRLAELFASEGMNEQAEKVFLESAEMLATENMPQEAEQVLDRAKSIASTALVFLTQFRISVIQKDFEGAIGHLDEGLNAFPQDADLLGAKAEALIQLQKPLDALKMLAEIPTLPERTLPACEKALKECQAKGMAREGLEAFAAAAVEATKMGLGGSVRRTLHNALNPQGDNALADYWLLQAEIANHGGSQEDRIESLKYALGLMEPGDSRVEATRKGLQDLGISDTDMTAAAPPNLMKLDESAPRTLPPELASRVAELTSEAEQHESNSKFDKAIEAYQGVLVIDPKNANAIDKITEIHKTAGMVTKAQAHLCAAAEKLASLGEPQLATHYLDKAESLLPGSTRVYRLTLGLLDEPASDAPPTQPPDFDEADAALLGEMATPAEKSVSQNELDESDLALADAPSPLDQALEKLVEQDEPLIPLEAMAEQQETTEELADEPMHDVEPQTEQQEEAGEEIEQTEQIEQPDQPEAQIEQQEETEGLAEEVEPPQTPDVPDMQDGGPDLAELNQALSSIDFQLGFGSPLEAKAEIERTLAIFPDSQELTNRLEITEEKIKLRQHAEPKEKDLASSLDLSDMLAPAQSTEVLNDNTTAAEATQTAEELFNAFRDGVAAKVGGDDYDTHYNLGIAYKEMMLADPAIEEFKKAMVDPERTLDCCSMLAMCEKMKGDVDAAANWLRVGIAAPGFPPIDSRGLRLDLAALLEEMGRHDESEELLEETRNLDGALWVN
ncbi:MAG: hypothetical protein LBC63_04825 [Holophagales bacterium]|jgi:tetratricopeptide (TPR) repeat protein|nr:hypothetical protein [Holophagales bacterium]